MRAYLDAFEAGDAPALRQCMFILPQHTRVADDTAAYMGAAVHLRRVIDTHFPGKDPGIDLSGADASIVPEIRAHLLNAKVTVQNNKAVIAGKPYQDGVPSSRANVDWHLRLDHGRWKVDSEEPQSEDHAKLLDQYPDHVGESHSESLAYLWIFHEITPGLQKIAADVETGRIKTIEEVQTQTQALVSAAFVKVETLGKKKEGQ